MAVTLISAINTYIGLAGDAKPTGVPAGSRYLAYDTDAIYITHNGTDWVSLGTDAAATIADGADVTQGAKADARSTATDATAVTAMQVLKEISYMEQNPAPRAVTPAATESHLGEVGGKGLQITVTPTLTVGATYAANDFVGTSGAGMTFAGAARIAAGTGRVVGAILHDYALASVAAELWLFTVTPAGLPADSAAFTITDNLTCIGVIPFGTYYASALNSISNGTIPNGQIPFKCAAADTSLYGALVTRGAPAYTNGLVSVSIFVDQD